MYVHTLIYVLPNAYKYIYVHLVLSIDTTVRRCVYTRVHACLHTYVHTGGDLWRHLDVEPGHDDDEPICCGDAPGHDDDEVICSGDEPGHDNDEVISLGDEPAGAADEPMEISDEEPAQQLLFRFQARVNQQQQQQPCQHHV